MTIKVMDKNGIVELVDLESISERFVSKIDAWYDRHERYWVVQKLDKEGYQIDDSIICPDKAIKDATVAELKEEFGL